MSDDLILVTGASGAIGGGLTDRLRSAGRKVRVGGRRPDVLTERWPGVDAVELDVLRPQTIPAAVDGVRAVVYLVHSMEAGVGHEFHMRDAEGARSIARAARDAGVERIVYLSGLGDEQGSLSEHLWSRQEVSQDLTSSRRPAPRTAAGRRSGS